MNESHETTAEAASIVPMAVSASAVAAPAAPVTRPGCALPPHYDSDDDDTSQKCSRSCSRECFAKHMDLLELARISMERLRKDVPNTWNNRIVACLLNSADNRETTHGTARQRTFYEFRIPFTSQSCCRKAYRFAADVDVAHLRTLQNHVREHDAKPYEHGLIGKPSNARVKDVVEAKMHKWLIEFSLDNSVTNPQSLTRALKPRMFDHIFTKAEVWRQFVAAWSKEPSLADHKMPCYATFDKRLDTVLAFVKFNEPATDCCDECHDLKLLQSEAAGKAGSTGSQAERALWLSRERIAINLLLQHEHIADGMRDFHKRQLHMYATIELCFAEGVVVLCFDYSAAISLPHFIRVPSRLYFLTGIRIQLFGVWRSWDQSMDTFFQDEELWKTIKRGANSVANLLYSYITSLELRHPVTGAIKLPEVLLLWADNCQAQNKNYTVLCLFAWLVAVGACKVRRIEMRYMLTGHTKFEPDRLFGEAKVAWKTADVFTKKAALAAWSASSTKNRASDGSAIDYFDWEEGFDAHLTIPDLASYHLFVFDVARPWQIGVARAYEDALQWFPLFTQSAIASIPMTADGFSKLAKSGGLADWRKAYIHQKLAPMVPPEELKEEPLYDGPDATELLVDSDTDDESFEVRLQQCEKKIGPIAASSGVQPAGSLATGPTAAAPLALPVTSSIAGGPLVISAAPEAAPAPVAPKPKRTSRKKAEEAIPPSPAMSDEALALVMQNEDLAFLYGEEVVSGVPASFKRGPRVRSSADDEPPHQEMCEWCECKLTDMEDKDVCFQWKTKKCPAPTLHSRCMSQVVPPLPPQLSSIGFRKNVCVACYVNGLAVHCPNLVLDMDASKPTVVAVSEFTMHFVSRCRTKGDCVTDRRRSLGADFASTVLACLLSRSLNFHPARVCFSSVYVRMLRYPLQTRGSGEKNRHSKKPRK